MPAGLIAAVAPASFAERVGAQTEDRLLAINGHPLRDVIDVHFYGADRHLSLQIERRGASLILEGERRYGEPLGLTFAHTIFDEIRRCDNRCEFCFVSQMPPGLRRSLYVRDDDYRLSFLHGAYITLTNLEEVDWTRIAAQHLSPLYISVHATEPRLRRQALRNPTAPPVLPQLRRLADLGIEMHTQIVLTPGLNDGPHLDHSFADLAELHPAVRSVSVVPLGLTRYHRGGCRLHTEVEMRQVVEQVKGWQNRLRPVLGVTFAYLADEWYLRLDEPVPPLAAYDGLDLTENGVGLVRRFLHSARSRLGAYRSASVVTGTLFGPTLRTVTELDVLPIHNLFFGETVTVAGLLTARDVIEQLRGRDLGDVVLLPPAMFGGPEGQTLDGMSPCEIGAALDAEVVADEGK